MNNINLKQIAKGLIVLLSAVSVYFILVSLIIMLNVINGIYRDQEPDLEFMIDKNDQKVLLKSYHFEKKAKIFDLELNLLSENGNLDSPEFSNTYVDWVFYNQNAKENIKNISSSCIAIGSHFDYRSNESWYYMTQQKYFIGYDRTTAKIVGYIGTNGFVKLKKDVLLFENVKHLESLGEDLYYLVSENKVYSIQFRNRKTIFLHQEMEGQIKSISAKFENTSDYSKYKEVTGFVVCTDKQIMTYDSEGNIKSTLNLPKNLQPKTLHRYTFNEKHYLHYINHISELEAESIINELSPNGDILWSYTFKNYRLDQSKNILPFQISIPFMGCVTINFLSRFYEVDFLQVSNNPLEDAMFRKFGQVNFTFWLTLLITALCMFFVFWHLSKRTDSKHTIILWLLIIFVFSIPGVIAYLIYYGHYKTIICSHCGKRFLPIKNSCLICSKEIPQGKLDGREIFSTN